MSTISHIKNPLTIIAVFAGLVEVSATTVLPFIHIEHLQSRFLWFLISFPSLLVMLFFITLNFNNKVLYSPSDYQSDKGFMDANIKGNSSQDSKVEVDNNWDV